VRSEDLKIFREPANARDQVMLLPPCVEDFVAQDDPARAVDEIIDEMDLSDLVGKYSGGGAPAYDPRMMMKIMVFGYCQGIRSSRRLDALLGQDLRFMYLAQMSRPDFRTISRFRKENREAVGKAFEETVRISLEMGLVLLAHASLDGTKIEANVSGRHTYRKERLEKALEAVDTRIAEILEEAEGVDDEEDKLYGDARGDEMPMELADAHRRKELLKRAKEHLQETRRETVCATDLDSRVMKTQSGNRAAYNAQAVVDKGHQIVVAARVTQDESDNHQMPVMMQETQRIAGKKPECLTMDGGYFSDETLKYADEHKLNIYVPDNQPGRSKEGFEYDHERDEYVCPCGERLSFYNIRERKGRIYRVYRRSCALCQMREPCCGASSRVKELWRRMNGELQEKMSAKMQTDEARQVYSLRKQIVEPVFGDIKENKKLRRFLLRGVVGAETEYLLGCIAHNIGKITSFRSKEAVAAA
jgi:transposase